MSRYLDRLRGLNSENVPPVGAAITAKSPSDSFDSTKGCRFPESQPAGGASAWTSRRAVLCDQWHAEWTVALTRDKAWLRAHPEAKAPADEALRDLLTATVRGWNTRTGDKRTTAELRAQLSEDDLSDRELMTRPWLSLCVWALWRIAPEAT